MYNIDFDLLLSASEYFRKLGYKTLSAPLVADKDIINLTLPSDRTPRPHLDKYYVGSAEQSFYQLLKDGFIPFGKYMLITPCVRDERVSETHLEIFLKIELISTDNNFTNIFNHVYDFYTELKLNPKLVNTPEGLDIHINGIEVGSYGSRSIQGREISYGTGMAFPRITQAINNKPG